MTTTSGGERGGRRTAPHPEWVQMYRQGVHARQIAALAGVGVRTVRYHLRIASQADPVLRKEYKAAAGPIQRIPGSGVRNMNDVIALYVAEGRFPSTHAASARERALAVWLYRRREEAQKGTLPDLYREGFRAIPGWEQRPPPSVRHETRWNQRLSDVAAYLAAGNNWPRHKSSDSEQERVLGVWLHVQRIYYRNGKLRADRETKLNTVLPGWKEGRAGSRARKP
jgi:hypothetical protein